MSTILDFVLFRTDYLWLQFDAYAKALLQRSFFILIRVRGKSTVEEINFEDYKNILNGYSKHSGI